VTLEADVIEGRKAQALLEDPTLKKAFDDVDTAIVDRWKAAPLRDADGAHELKLMHKLLWDVWANLELSVSNGKLAAEELKRSKEKPTRWWAINQR
jgi:hypothetical protein